MFTVKVERKQHLDLSRVAIQLKGPKHVKVGFPASEASASNIEKAIWNEFGTRGGASGGGWGGPVPERPFMRNAMRDNAGAYHKALKVSRQSCSAARPRFGRFCLSWAFSLKATSKPKSRR